MKTKKIENPKALFAKCGNTCSSCPTFKANLVSPEARKRCSTGWEKYLGIKLSPEKLRPCDGCQYPDAKKPTRYLNCRTRKCAVFNGVLTCAHCSAYPCKYLPHMESASREKIESILGERISDEVYYTFIEPYEWRRHLESIRESLAPKDIKEMKKASYVPKTTPFPSGLSGSQAPIFLKLHQLISTIGSEKNVSYARLDALKDERSYALKLLWIFGRFGKLEEKQLVMDAKTYIGQKMFTGYSKVVNIYLELLTDSGVSCEFVQLAEKGWLTPGGALRPQGWFMKMTFNDAIEGLSILKAFVSYVDKLNREYGSKAYGYFSKADMGVLAE